MKKRVLSMLLAVCLLIALFPALPAFAADAPELLYLAPSTASNLPSRIELYPDPSGGQDLYHLYLPGNAVVGNCFLSWEGGASATLGGRSYQSGALPVPAPGETETVTFGSKKFIIRTYQGSPGVKPIFIEIDESQGTIAAMNADPNHNTTCTGEIVIDGERMALPQIKGRGNATWRDDKEKKPYNIKLDTKVNLLGIDCDKTKKWSLLSNVNDRTLLRNKVAYDLAHQMGIGFDSASVDLWMNGVYWGTYLLTPKTDSFITDDGYLIEDNNISDNDEPHIDGTGMILNIKEIGKNLLLAEGENIEDSATVRAAASKISSYFKEAWNAVSADNGKNSKGKHYSEYFDMDSMAAFYLLHEFIKNLEVDGGSIFIHRDGTSDTDKLIAGPAWDYDNSMGYNGQQTMAVGGSGWPSDARSTNYASLSIGNWYITGRNRGKLFGTFSKHQDFLDLTHEVYNRYYKLFDDVSANVRRQAALIADSAEMNFVRTVKEDKNNFDFPDERVNGKYYGQLQFDAGTPYEVNYKAPEVWPDYVDNLVTYTTGRARFFRDQMYVENTCEHDYKAVVTAPTCTEKGFTTYTCSKCGDSYVDQEVPTLGHNFVNGVCTRCGQAAMKATFVCDEGVSVTVYDKQDLTGAHENATEAFPRDSVSGEIDVSGSGQVNFVVNVAPGYQFESIAAEPAANYKNFKLPEETLVPNGYRITKMTGDVTVTVKAVKNECQHNYKAVVTPATCTAQGFTTYTCTKCGDSYVSDYTAKIAHNYQGGVCTVCGEKLLNVNISCGEGASVTVYETQKADGPSTANAGSANPRDGDSGLIDCSGEGQVNFQVVLADGYELESVTAEPTSAYKNLKGPSDTGMDNGYRVTKVTGDFAITVTARRSGVQPATPTARFVCDEGVSITTYETQDQQGAHENATEAFARNSATGEVDASGEGQVNFVVNVAEGYKLESITAEPAANYKNFKLPDETLVPNGYRITKMTGDVTVTVKAVETECQHDYQAVETPATCTAQGFKTYTCSKCGDSYVSDYTAKIAHNYVGGVCTVCGEKLLNVTISCNEGASVTVFETQKADGPKVENAATANPRDGDSGLIDCSGEGQVNFQVVLADGYELESVTAEPASAYKNLKGPADTGMENGYRITKVKGDFTITVKAKKAACEHDYKAVVTPPTCTEKGYTTYTCSKCGDSYVGDEEAALGHDYKAVVTAPTCTEKGYTTYTCSRCGDKYTGRETDALGHSFGQWTTTKAATCTAEGEQTRTCARCGEKETRKTDALGHDYRAVVTAPTCTAKGYTTYTCSRCGDSYRGNETAALGHDYKAVVTAPTCTAKGYTTYTCSRCGDKYIGNETDALGHDWGTGIVTKEPTETNTGIRTYTCSRCGEKRTEVIPELSHVHKYTAVVTPPTCTEAGYTTHTCICGDSYVDTPVPALGHSYGQWTTTKAATCTEKGVETRTCARCDDAETRETAALGHSFGDWTVTTPATCTEKGVETRTCARCDDAETREIDALGHDLVEHEAKTPTCTETGWAAYQACSRCDYTTCEELPALGHDYKDGVCTRCGEKDPDYVPPVDYTALNAAIEEAEKVELNKYTDESAAAFAAALAAAKEALKAEKQDDVDEAKAALEAAKAALVEKPVFRFDDVKDESQYYFDPVYWAVDNGITTGATPTTFSPGAGCTRAQVVTFLWRAAGKPEPTKTENPFGDVQPDAYYYKAVLWAVEKGITTGTSATTFRPDQTCTRGQIVTFLWRYNEQPEPKSSTNPFTDVPAGQYYYKAVLWAVEKGVTKGTSADKFSPDSTCTRAQIVTFLYRAEQE